MPKEPKRRYYTSRDVMANVALAFLLTLAALVWGLAYLNR